MATVYAPPKHLGAPPDFSSFSDASGRYDFEAHNKAEQAWVKTVQDEARARNKGDIVGEIVRFPMADGYAQYVVWSTNPAALIHLPVGDAWDIPEAHARGLRTSDLRQQVAAHKAMDKLFGRKP